MSVVLASIVEGDGEVEAVPVLLRAAALRLGLAPEIPRPMRLPRSRLVRAGEIERAAEFVRGQHGADARLLVLIDADDDCPGRLGPTLLARVSRSVDLRASVVLAKGELEAWFLAGIESLRGRRGVRPDAEPPTDIEGPRSAKGRLEALMTRSYAERTDAPAFAALLDLDLARGRAPSFDKLLRDIERLLRADAA